MDGVAADLHHIRPWRRIERRRSRKIRVGPVEVGGDAPIAVQSMTNTVTADAAATIAQVRQLEEAGADIVRVSCPDEASTAAFAQVARAAKVPLVADIHFHYRRAIEAAAAGAACLRINPGNIGNAARVKEVVQAAKDHGCAIRIGVNAGSLEQHLLEKYGEPCPEAMVESALYHAALLEEHGFRDYKISVKASDVFLTVAAYQALAEATDAPLHLGVTEAGALRAGTVKSSIAMGSLLWAGIGDTIRVSLAADPVEEVKVGHDLLKSLGLRQRGVTIIACPSCARQGFNVIATVDELERRLAHIKEPITLSIIGCVVNGPGEALMTDLGFTGGGKGAGMMYVAGKADHKVDNAEMIDHIVELIEVRAAQLRNPQERA
jgi:(E)-4-hydroxy-3-methylbut-2-enyl-diphosphate synthase